MKVLMYALMSYPLTVMVQDNDGFILITKQQETKQVVEEVEKKETSNQFNPNLIKLKIKVNDEKTN
ncbi:hypothetical protein [Vibrio anguillarum]|jgi:hypothetical protein|uniref:Uncharacterized protein n=1 Tax=Vibrio anguillarum TaxID=55601 RepID=A0AAW4BLI6_VIBAN|nr:hypothetical protein [Vibrio anguillarum]MBF4374129.1 hypothetical protein [Vibrio anguillarum]MBF4437931.1 hypothetical protein [Vibrio anguillarum]